jgi:LmbE family N-acetylglucosaminyl deacetylase
MSSAEALPRPEPAAVRAGPNDFAIDVHAALDRKIAALVAHRSQYALEAGLLPPQVLGPLLGTEHFTAVT